MTQKWVEPDIRDNVAGFVNLISPLTDVPLEAITRLIGISSSKYYSWIDRKSEFNNHNGKTTRGHWCLDWEREAIINFAKKHP